MPNGQWLKFEFVDDSYKFLLRLSYFIVSGKILFSSLINTYI